MFLGGYKAGECPPLTAGAGGICVEGCASDYDCTGTQKCCSNGCGHTCREPNIGNTVYPCMT